MTMPYLFSGSRWRLTRGEQLTLTTWRYAAARYHRQSLPPVLEVAGLHAVLASLRSITNPLELIRCHVRPQAAYALLTSVVDVESTTSDALLDILDTAYLMRWTELVADGHGPAELPPLRPVGLVTSIEPVPAELRRRVTLRSLHGDIVADPFVGRGTTAAVAARLGRVAWPADGDTTASAGEMLVLETNSSSSSALDSIGRMPEACS